jgi:hypothetical protein
MTIDQLIFHLRAYANSGLGAYRVTLGACDAPLHDLEVIEEVHDGQDITLVLRSQEQC